MSAIADAPPIRHDRWRARRLPNGLLPQHEAFCHAVAGGMTQTAAYWHHVSKVPDEIIASNKASELLRDGSPCRRRVQELVLEADKAAQAARLLTKQEVGEFLANVIRKPIGEIDHNSPLCQERVYTVGREEDSVKIKMPSKLDAAKVAIGLYGWDEPQKHVVAVGGAKAVEDVLADWFAPKVREVVATEIDGDEQEGLGDSEGHPEA